MKRSRSEPGAPRERKRETETERERVGGSRTSLHRNLRLRSVPAASLTWLETVHYSRLTVYSLSSAISFSAHLLILLLLLRFPRLLLLLVLLLLLPPPVSLCLSITDAAYTDQQRQRSDAKLSI